MESLDNAYASRVMNKPYNSKIINAQQKVTSAFRGNNYYHYEDANGSDEARIRTGLNSNIKSANTLTALRLLGQGAP